MGREGKEGTGQAYLRSLWCRRTHKGLASRTAQQGAACAVGHTRTMPSSAREERPSSLWSGSSLLAEQAAHTHPHTIEQSERRRAGGRTYL